MALPRQTNTLTSYIGVLAVMCLLVTAAAVVIARPWHDLGQQPGDDPNAVGLVASGPVEVEVREVALSNERVDSSGRTMPGGAAQVLTSRPETASGYATVGVTWKPSAHDLHDLTVLARTQRDGSWSDWFDFQYDDHHAPEPSTDAGREVRAGTDPYVVGEVDHVQIKVEVPPGTELPDDLRLSIVDPGADRAATFERPALAGDEPAGDAVQSSAAAPAPRPGIFSRAQWGADERLRDPGSLRYGTIKLGFVHHTVNANSYTRAQVPSLLRGIYAYHTRSRGWSDIGYNFVVDRFGRIWEGRAGGVARPVTGAHTLGYNHLSFAMSALGNFDTAPPSRAMVSAYGRLFAWKLSLHGVRPQTRVRIGSRTFDNISGHKDAGSTACPGRYLYAKLPAIRSLAAAGGVVGNVRPTRPFRVRGRSILGRTLTATGGALAPAGSRVGYQWIRGGMNIPGARGSSYRVTPQDLGRVMRVRITATKPQYRPWSTLLSRGAAKSYSDVKLVARGGDGTVAVRIWAWARGGVKPWAWVTVRVGKTTGKVWLKNGKGALSLSGIKPGRPTVWVTLAPGTRHLLRKEKVRVRVR